MTGPILDEVNGNHVLTVDPRLGPLQDNGGPTFTHAPAADSIAIDNGSSSLDPSGSYAVDLALPFPSTVSDGHGTQHWGIG